MATMSRNRTINAGSNIPRIWIFICLALFCSVAAEAMMTKEIIKLCGCPEDSACPGYCDVFTLNECQPMYQCFSPANDLFGYIRPESVDAGDENGKEIRVSVYDDENCQGNPRFDPTTNGWQGSCDSTCWDATTSKIGAAFCGVLEEEDDPPMASDTTSTSLTLQALDDPENGIVEVCSCPDSPCPGNCDTFQMNQCQPFYQCLQEVNGIFAYVIISPHSATNIDTKDVLKITMTVYNDENCQNPRFSADDMVSNGFQGSCQSACWSSISNIGAPSCGIQSAFAINESSENSTDIPHDNDDGNSDGGDGSNSSEIGRIFSKISRLICLVASIFALALV